MKHLILFLILFAPSLNGFAAERKFVCTYRSGDELSTDGSDRLSQKMELVISEGSVSLVGKIWGKLQTDSGRKGEDEAGRATYEGFSLIRDENPECKLLADKSLLERGSGKVSVQLKGDGKNTVDLRYEFQCP